MHSRNLAGHVLLMEIVSMLTVIVAPQNCRHGHAAVWRATTTFYFLLSGKGTFDRLNGPSLSQRRQIFMVKNGFWSNLVHLTHSRLSLRKSYFWSKIDQKSQIFENFFLWMDFLQTYELLPRGIVLQKQKIKFLGFFHIRPREGFLALYGKTPKIFFSIFEVLCL